MNRPAPAQGQMLPLVSPEAASILLRLAAHLGSSPANGAYVVLIGEVTEDGVALDSIGHDLSRVAILAAARAACKHVIADMRACPCGSDHARDIADLEHAELLLSGDHRAIPVQ